MPNFLSVFCGKQNNLQFYNLTLHFLYAYLSNIMIFFTLPLSILIHEKHLQQSKTNRQPRRKNAEKAHNLRESRDFFRHYNFVETLDS